MTSAYVDQNAGYRSFNISELKQNGGGFVPNRGDTVVDTAMDVIYKVESVNYDTGIANLKLFELRNSGDILGIVNYYVSNGPFDIDDSRRVYIDYSLVPPVARIDASLRIPGTEAHHVVLFKGEDVTTQLGIPVSLFYHRDNPNPSQSIPLLISTPAPDANNPAIKVAEVFYVTEDLPHGSIVTAVIYNDTNVPLETIRLVVHRTEDVRRDNTLSRYITGIRLLSPFSRSDNPRVIEIPINATLADVPMEGEVRYSDGEVVTMPLGGSKFRLVGTDNYVSTSLGARTAIHLEYHLGKNERYIRNNNSVAGIIDEPYIFLSVRGNGLDDAASNAYAAKLYGYPRWLPGSLVYTMEYFMTLNDGVYYPVTALVRPSSQGAQFNGANLGITQNFIVTINLNTVDNALRNYTHVQVMSVNLARRGDESMIPLWTVAYQDSINRYGEGLYLRGASQNQDNTAWSCYYVQPGTPKADFLERSYYRSRPLYDPAILDEPEVPTHMVISRFNSANPVEVSLATEYGNPIAMSGLLVPGELMIIKFIKRSVSGDKVLSVCGVPFLTL